MNVGGVVLCGGASTRMGRPKAWLPIAGELMLPRVLRLLGEVASPLVVVASSEQELPALPPQVLVARDEKPGRGPLQGLAAGLAALRGQADAVYISSCDVPFLQPAFVRRLIDLLGEDAACVPHVGGHHHPLAAAYRLSVLDEVQQLLEENRLAVHLLFERVPTRSVAAAEFADVDPSLKTLRNINTPEEYAAAVREFDCGA
jgi:molybdopterin-guanine dinucleotide biosynthesis protein A